ncbi:hypothetical protein LIA77_05103 [Sarocladium implicatum]|nr:hypothetical protein LIA77_05103 [Sarocladium implicatum]
MRQATEAFEWSGACLRGLASHRSATGAATATTTAAATTASGCENESERGSSGDPLPQGSTAQAGVTDSVIYSVACKTLCFSL